MLGGFSMGSVMSYAMALGADRPAVAGILAFSGFVPAVDGWEPSLADRAATRAFIAHGRRDPIIEVGFAQRARDLLEAGGLAVEYRESDIGHQIDPSHLADATDLAGARRCRAERLLGLLAGRSQTAAGVGPPDRRAGGRRAPGSSRARRGREGGR